MAAKSGLVLFLSFSGILGFVEVDNFGERTQSAKVFLNETIQSEIIRERRQTSGSCRDLISQIRAQALQVRQQARQTRAELQDIRQRADQQSIRTNELSGNLFATNQRLNAVRQRTGAVQQAVAVLPLQAAVGGVVQLALNQLAGQQVQQIGQIQQQQLNQVQQLGQQLQNQLQNLQNQQSNNLANLQSSLGGLNGGALALGMIGMAIGMAAVMNDMTLVTYFYPIPPTTVFATETTTVFVFSTDVRRETTTSFRAFTAFTTQIITSPTFLTRLFTESTTTTSFSTVSVTEVITATQVLTEYVPETYYLSYTTEYVTPTCSSNYARSIQATKLVE